MTPERIKEIGDSLYRELCGPDRYNHEISAIERAIRQAVNEFAEEAATVSDGLLAIGTKDWHKGYNIATEEIKARIIALKLPEE